MRINMKNKKITIVKINSCGMQFCYRLVYVVKHD